MSDPRVDKCVRDGRLLKATCNLMGEVLEDFHAGSKKGGIFQLDLISTAQASLKPHTQMIAIKSGEHKVRGVYIRFCPFCGESLDIEEEKKEASDG